LQRFFRLLFCLDWQKWRSDIENSPKGLSYRLFKENFEFEHYLDILPDKDRIKYCRFRTGNHRLPIETGRWHRIERQNRHCNLCQYQELGEFFKNMYIYKMFAILLSFPFTIFDQKLIMRSSI
jgi:hypothetical protein